MRASASRDGIMADSGCSHGIGDKVGMGSFFIVFSMTLTVRDSCFEVN
jgi:hypothetical protein